MKTTIDSAGRLVIPKEVRREAGLKPGMPLEVRWHEGRIEIEPAPWPVKLVRKGRLLVAVPENVCESSDNRDCRTDAQDKSHLV